MKGRALLALAALSALLGACAGTQQRQPGPDDFRVYRGDGSPASLDELYAAMRAADVTFLGESHDDPVAHYLERRILEEGPQDNLALALEMFETDVQLVLDEYLAGLISEERLIEDGHAWDNYEEAYAPLVDLARERKLPVLAANAPRRYVSLVSQEGPDALQRLDPAALAFLPPLPYPEPSPAYREKFLALMTRHMPEGAHGEDAAPAEGDEMPAPDPGEETSDMDGAEEAATPSTTLQRMLDAQALWDATMAWSLARHLEARPGARVLHVNGSFHTEGRLGIVEQLAGYRPEAEALVVTLQPSAAFPAFAEDLRGAGDFVIVTPAD